MDKLHFKQAFLTCIDKLAKELESFPWHDAGTYAAWLAQTYYLVRHTTRYLALTAGKFGVERDDLHKRALEHLREEKDHDVFAIKDLHALDFVIEDFPELPETSVIYQSQFYWIEMVSAVSHFGYAFLLEGLAAEKGDFIKNSIERAHGSRAALFMRVHASDDVDHFEKGMQVLTNLPVVEQQHILKNLQQSQILYSNMLKAVLAYAQQNKSGITQQRAA